MTSVIFLKAAFLGVAHAVQHNLYVCCKGALSAAVVILNAVDPVLEADLFLADPAEIFNITFYKLHISPSLALKELLAHKGVDTAGNYLVLGLLVERIVCTYRSDKLALE